MPKFIYVGDPTPHPKTGKVQGPAAGGECAFRLDSGKVVRFVAGEPTEVPDELVPRLKNNTHFKVVEEKLAAAAPAKTDESEKQGDQKLAAAAPAKK